MKFEDLVVGKKYARTDFNNAINKVIYKDEIGFLFEIEGGLSSGQRIWWGRTALKLGVWIDYVPPPIKKNGWIVMWRDAYGVHIPTSRPRDSSEQAKAEFENYFNGKYDQILDTWTAQVYWTEPAPAEDEDTI